MSERVWEIPRGDKRVGKFAVRLDGAYVDLTGYDFAWVVRDAPTLAGAVVDSGSAQLQPDGKSALLEVGEPTTTTGGIVRYFSATATPPEGSGKPGPFTYSCLIDVTEHA